MKIFRVEFFSKINKLINKENSGMNYYELIARESDLENLKEYGGGIKNINYIGNLFEFESKPLGITIKTEVVGLEEASELTKELRNILDSMEVKFRVG